MDGSYASRLGVPADAQSQPAPQTDLHNAITMVEENFGQLRKRLDGLSAPEASQPTMVSPNSISIAKPSRSSTRACIEDATDRLRDLGLLILTTTSRIDL